MNLFPVHLHLTHPPKPITQICLMSFPDPDFSSHPQREVISPYGLPNKMDPAFDGICQLNARLTFPVKTISSYEAVLIYDSSVCGPKDKLFCMQTILCRQDSVNGRWKKSRYPRYKVKKPKNKKLPVLCIHIKIFFGVIIFSGLY